jgi:predicted flap endonuclease-1-like 5' DNA nuclease
MILVRARPDWSYSKFVLGQYVSVHNGKVLSQEIAEALGCPYEEIQPGDPAYTEEYAKQLTQKVEKPPTNPLTAVDGVGAKTAEKLGEAGIESLDDLVAASTEIVSADLSVDPTKVQAWQAHAQELIDGASD